MSDFSILFFYITLLREGLMFILFLFVLVNLVEARIGDVPLSESMKDPKLKQDKKEN